MPGLFFVSMLLFVTVETFGQSTGEFSGPFPKEPERTVSKPVRHKTVFSGHHEKAFKYKQAKITHTAQYEFYKRVEVAAKQHMKELKELSKPQYSNFLYFGHKRKPKKHSADKMRYCPECGIRH
jgi:hypothetical protein